MPQLDVYIVFSEIFWFTVFFSVAYFFVYYFIVFLHYSFNLIEFVQMNGLINSGTLQVDRSRVIRHYNLRARLISTFLSIKKFKLLSLKELARVKTFDNRIFYKKNG